MRHLDDKNARWTEQNHGDRNAALAKRHIADEGIASLQLMIEEINNSLLRLQFIGPVQAKLQHAFKALSDAKLAFFIEKRGFIYDLHIKLEKGCLLQFIAIRFRTCRNDFLALAVLHLYRLSLLVRGSHERFWS